MHKSDPNYNFRSIDECNRLHYGLEKRVDRNTKLIIAIILITQGIGYANHLGLW